jgi:signal transduction histidine kinase
VSAALPADVAFRVCHELSRPLSEIWAFAEILEDGVAGPLNEDQRAHVAAILRSSDALARLIREIRDSAAPAGEPAHDLDAESASEPPKKAPRSRRRAG